MNWFKHDTNASTDAKIKKLLLRYGTDGYAIYFHCLELIADTVNENNINFELEHDAEIIADNLKVKGTSDKSPIDIVNEVMKYIIELGLFQASNNKIFCLKMVKRLDTSMTSNPRFRKLITDAKQHHDTVMINHDTVMKEENRKDNIIKEENRKDNITIDNDINSPHMEIAAEFYKQYSKKKAILLVPTEKDNLTAKSIYDRLPDIEYVKKLIPIFFDDSYEFWFNKDKAYYFKSFANNIETLISVENGTYERKKEKTVLDYLEEIRRDRGET